MESALLDAGDDPITVGDASEGVTEGVDERSGEDDAGRRDWARALTNVVDGVRREGGGCALCARFGGGAERCKAADGGGVRADGGVVR